MKTILPVSEIGNWGVGKFTNPPSQWERDEDPTELGQHYGGSEQDWDLEKH